MNRAHFLVQLLVFAFHECLQDRAGDLAIPAPNKDESNRKRCQRCNLHRHAIVCDDRQKHQHQVFALRTGIGVEIGGNHEPVAVVNTVDQAGES